VFVNLFINYGTSEATMADDRPRIEGKFYPLQNDEWLQACKELKPAELKLLYHLRTLTPFGDHSVELGVTEIALQLGMSKSTVSEGLKALSQKGWIDLELIKVKVRLKTVRPSERCSPQRTIVV
jgi:DNA-binding MarR family transcriptional regulator